MTSSVAAIKVLVTAQAFAVSGQNARSLLEAKQCQLIQSRSWGPLSREQLIEQALDCDAIIAATDPYDAETFESLPKLKLVARCGVGIDSVQLVDATRSGILVSNVPSAMTDAVADYCMGLILSLSRQIHLGYECMQAGGWAEMPGVELRGKTLGLVGLGQIGQAVAERSRGFGLTVVAHDPHLPKSIWAARFPWVESLELSELLERSHFVSLHAPNIRQTHNMINASTLARMRRDAYLINTSRGALVDEDALIRALHDGTIAGAAIDVYRNEPLPKEHPLRITPNLLLTPHNAFNSKEAALRMSFGCSEPLLDLLNGHIPSHVCNPEVIGSPQFRWPIPLSPKETGHENQSR
jgi:D-3-phosphoglycerate dehydrogenase / 2-oxoglutarate reductase